MVPLPKAGKGPKLPGKKRPISLLSSFMEIGEGVICRRILPKIEPNLYGGQYAYLRARSTELHLAMLMDRVHRALLRNR